MTENTWLQTLLEKMDRDRRDAEQRNIEGVKRIERLIALATERANARADQLNSRLDAAYHFYEEAVTESRKAADQAGKWALATFISVAALAAAAFIALFKSFNLF